MLLYRKSASCYQANIFRNVQTTYWAFDLAGLGQTHGIFWGQHGAWRMEAFASKPNNRCYCM